MKFTGVWVVLRFLLGFTFLWAFFDKVFGLGFATAPDKSWLSGVSPTSGYLTHAAHGPLTSFYQSLAGNPLVDWLFMLGLLLIGTSLVLGIGLKIAAWSGSLLLLLLYLSGFPPANNPFVDEHIIYIPLLFGIAYSDADGVLGIGDWWSRTKLVKRNPILR